MDNEKSYQEVLNLHDLQSVYDKISKINKKISNCRLLSNGKDKGLTEREELIRLLALVGK